MPVSHSVSYSFHFLNSLSNLDEMLYGETWLKLGDKICHQLIKNSALCLSHEICTKSRSVPDKSYRFRWDKYFILCTVNHATVLK
jgi:hypothetical protein